MAVAGPPPSVISRKDFEKRMCFVEEGESGGGWVGRVGGGGVGRVEVGRVEVG